MKTQIGLYESDRVERCPVLVKLSSADGITFYWVEFYCTICGANCLPKNSKYFSGVQGVLGHLSKQHQTASQKPRDGYTNRFVFDYCLRRQLDDLKAIAEQNGLPIEKSFGRQVFQQTAIAQSIQPSESSNDQEYSDASADAHRFTPHDLRRRRGTLGIQDSGEEAETNVSIAVESCAVICYHESRGTLEIFCHICKGNSVVDTATADPLPQILLRRNWSTYQVPWIFLRSRSSTARRFNVQYRFRYFRKESPRQQMRIRQAGSDRAASRRVRCRRCR